MKNIRLTIQGMRCASRASSLERSLIINKGIVNAKNNTLIDLETR